MRQLEAHNLECCWVGVGQISHVSHTKLDLISPHGRITRGRWTQGTCTHPKKQKNRICIHAYIHILNASEGVCVKRTTLDLRAQLIDLLTVFELYKYVFANENYLYLRLLLLVCFLACFKCFCKRAI